MLGSDIIFVHKIYGIDYNDYFCGGIGNAKLGINGENTELFYTESEMLTRLSKLKEDYKIGNIKVFTTKIIREDYNI